MHAQKFLISLLAAIVLQSISLLVSAADYAGGFNMNVDASHNDNIRLAPSDKTSVQKYHAAPTLTFSAATENTKIELNSTFDFNRYDKSEFDSNDQNLALALSHQLERGSIGLNVAYINNSTLTSELLTSGRIGNKAERTEQYQLSPQWTYSINETNLLQTQASFTAQDYHSNAYTGYKNTGAEVDWLHMINERIKLVTAVTYSDYQSDDIKFGVPTSEFVYTTSDPTSPGEHKYFLPGIDVVGISADAFGEQSYAPRTKNVGGQIGIDYQSTEQSLLSGRFGRSRNTSTYPIKDPNNICSNSDYLRLISDFNRGVAVLGSGSLETICSPLPNSEAWLSTAEIEWGWSNERQQFKLNTTKSTQPTSNGYTVDATQIGSSWSYQFTALNQLSANLTLVRNRAIDKKSTLQNASIADRDYGSATLAYQRQLSERWFLRASYTYSEQKYTQNNSRASSKILTLSINYRPQQWHWSR